MDVFIIIILGACGLVIWLLHVIRNKFDKTPDFLQVEEEDYQHNKCNQSSYAEQDQQIEDLFDIIEEHINNGDRASADANLEAFEEIIRKYPNRSYAYTQYAKALSLQTEDEFNDTVINPNRDKILELIHKAVEIDPEKSDVYFAWSNILHDMALQQDTESGKKELLLDAILKCEKAIELNPNNDLPYLGYADILEELYYITEDKDLIIKCDDLYEKAVQIEPSSYNYSLWADLKTRFADSINNSDLYLKALNLYDIALIKNQEKLSRSLSDMSDNSETSPLGKTLKDMYKSMHKIHLYDKARILKCKINVLEKYGLMADDIHSFEAAIELHDTLSTVFLEVAPDKDMTKERQSVIYMELEIASRKGSIGIVASKLEAEVIGFINKKDKDYNAFKLMMILKSLTGEVKEAFDWFTKLIQKVEDLEDLNWEAFEKDIKLTNLVKSQEYIQYKSLHYKEEEIEDDDEEITSTNTDNTEDNQVIDIKARYAINESLSKELKEQADTLSVQALENQDVTLFEEAIQKYKQCRLEAENVGDKQLISNCDLQIVQNIIQLSKLKNDLSSATLDIESRIVDLFDSHFQEVCILAIKLKALIRDTNSAMEWLDRLRKGSESNKIDWTYFDQDEDFKNLVQSYEYNQYKELFK